MRCSHNVRFEERCSDCVKEGLIRNASDLAIQTPLARNPARIDGFNGSIHMSTNTKEWVEWARMD